MYQYSTYYDSLGAEFTYLPATFTVGDQWEYPVVGSSPGQGYRKVISVDDSFSTLYCNNYTGLVEIGEYSSPNALFSTYWYKKGLGIVRWKTLINADLLDVSLK